MFLGTKKKLEDHILEELANGPLRILDLITRMQATVPGVTKQGVYYALRVLRAQEVVVVHKGYASINVRWLNKMNRYTLTAQQHYFTAQQRAGDIAALQDGEKVQYFFKDPATTDLFWAHALTIFSRLTDPAHPFIAYDPHCWFFITSENEAALRDAMNADGRAYLIAVHGRTPLDKYIQNEFDGTASQYYMSAQPLFKKENYYLNLMGEYVIEVWLDPETERAIQRLYKQTTTYTPQVQKELQHIVQRRGRTKLVISRNKKKAARLQKRLQKYFYIPKRPATGK